MEEVRVLWRWRVSTDSPSLVSVIANRAGIQGVGGAQSLKLSESSHCGGVIVPTWFPRSDV